MTNDRALSIREMTAEDVVEISTLVGELGYPSDLVHVNERWASIASSTTENVLVILSGTKVIGFAHMAKELSLTGGSRAVLRSLIISAQNRGQGVGTELLKAVELFTEGLGICKLRIASQTKRTDAHRFYEQNGYYLLKTSHIFEKRLASAM